MRLETQHIYTQAYRHWCIQADELESTFPFIVHQWARTPCGPKAKVERFLVPFAGFFPDSLVIPRSIIPAQDIETVRTLLHEGVDQHYSMGIRSVADRPVYGGAKLPWEMEINTHDQVEHLVYASFPLWHRRASQQGYAISNIILMNNPPEIGTKKEQQNQFVFRLAWDNYCPFRPLGSQLLMEMVLGTNKMRNLDAEMDKGNERLVRSICLYTETGLLESKELSIGSAYLDVDGGCDLESGETIEAVLSFINTLIQDLNVQLLRRLEFFSEQGLSIVEFQGYVDGQTQKRHMLIYGLRGVADDTQTGLSRSRDWEESE